jgi:hypothetical protein
MTTEQKGVDLAYILLVRSATIAIATMWHMFNIIPKCCVIYVEIKEKNVA